MKPKHLSSSLLAATAFSAIAMILATAAWAAPKYQVLHAFGAGKDGAGLYGGLVFDRQGNLYGGTSGGGDYGYGTVYQLSPGRNGEWTEHLLRSFRDNDPDGDEINGTLTADAAGNLYGGTTFGGGPYTYGTVFEMTQGSSGWTLTVIHRFRPPIPACCPEAGMVMDQVGNLYGTAANPFELSPSSGRWKLTLLHNFPSYQGDGSGPYAVILDGAGNLYGETNMGGTSTLCGGGCGTVYELHRTSGGWKENILHDFGTGGDDMGFPGGALLLDKTGRLYGTAGGGTHAHGAVYRLTPQSGGHWKAAILHSFTGGANGDGPGGGVAMDKAGNLYGTTVAGGDPNCDCGVVYKLAPGSKGKWTYTVLHSFTGNDGAQPIAQLILDSQGNLYGTTITGGAGGYGVAFEITP